MYSLDNIKDLFEWVIDTPVAGYGVVAIVIMALIFCWWLKG